jgi:hypothetical protein
MAALTMTRPPNPKSAKVRKIKVWVADDIEKVINETLHAYPFNAHNHKE